MGCVQGGLARHAAEVAALGDRQIVARDFTISGAREAYAVQVHDGDTLRVCFRDRGAIVQWPVRLAGVDAPELREAAGPAARDALRALVFDGARPRRLTLVPAGFDKYGRLLAQVRVGGQDAAAALLARGLGRPMDARGRRA